MPRPTSPNSVHGASLDRRNSPIDTRSGLRPKGFSLGLGNSEKASELTFSVIFHFRPRQYLGLSSLHVAGTAFGAIAPTQAMSSRFKPFAKTHFAMAQTLGEMGPRKVAVDQRLETIFWGRKKMKMEFQISIFEKIAIG